MVTVAVSLVPPDLMWGSSKLSVRLSPSSSRMSSTIVTVNVFTVSPGAKTRFSGMPL